MLSVKISVVCRNAQCQHVFWLLGCWFSSSTCSLKHLLSKYRELVSKQLLISTWNRYGAALTFMWSSCRQVQYSLSVVATLFLVSSAGLFSCCLFLVRRCSLFSAQAGFISHTFLFSHNNDLMSPNPSTSFSPRHAITVDICLSVRCGGRSGDLKGVVG